MIMQFSAGKLKYWASLALFWPFAAFAQNAPLPPSIEPPKAVVASQNCVSPGIEIQIVSAVATLAFRITTMGTVKDIVVVVSSGYKDVDAMAVGCVSQWHYVPAMENGRPVEVSWKTNIYYKGISPADYTPPQQPADTPHTCSSGDVPQSFWANYVKADAVLSFRVATDGSVKDVVVSSTSQLKEIDDAAIRCVSNWRYSPAMQNGHPVEVPWIAKRVYPLDAGTE
jgi:TonB family protein